MFAVKFFKVYFLEITDHKSTLMSLKKNLRALFANEVLIVAFPILGDSSVCSWQIERFILSLSLSLSLFFFGMILHRSLEYLLKQKLNHLLFRNSLRCFHVLAIVNIAALNIEVHVSFKIVISSGYMCSSGSYGRFIPSF